MLGLGFWVSNETKSPSDFFLKYFALFEHWAGADLCRFRFATEEFDNSFLKTSTPYVGLPHSRIERMKRSKSVKLWNILFKNSKECELKLPQHNWYEQKLYTLVNCGLISQITQTQVFTLYWVERWCICHSQETFSWNYWQGILAISGFKIVFPEPIIKQGNQIKTKESK